MGYNEDYAPSQCDCAAVNDGVEHLVVVTYSSSSLVTVYVDGEMCNTVNLPNLNTQGNSNFLGKSNHVGYEGYFIGTIRGLKVYEYAMTFAQIMQLSPPSPSPPTPTP